MREQGEGEVSKGWEEGIDDVREGGSRKATSKEGMERGKDGVREIGEGAAIVRVQWNGDRAAA